MARQTLETLSASRQEAYNPFETNNAPINWAGTSYFNVPEHVKERYPDKDFTYVAIYSGGEHLYDNYDKALDEQWEPVTNEMYGETRRMSALDPFGRKLDQDVKRTYGQVLMMRDKVISKQQNDFFQSVLETQEEMTSKAHAPDLGGNSPYVIHNERSRTNAQIKR